VHAIPWGRAVAGLGIAGVIAAAAYAVRALSRSGAIAAVLMGTVVTIAGWSWGALLVAYFVVASALSRFRGADKRARTGGLAEKHGARDPVQVLANGGVFALGAVGFAVSPSVTWQAIAIAGLSASAADTWATEIGPLSPESPRSIVTLRAVPVGTSGGVTVVGLAASALAAGFTAGCAWLAGWPGAAILSAVIGGFAGSVLDSLLGATLQARRYCVVCDEETERRVHGCGTLTDVTRGLGWMDNDAVNAMSTIGGALLGAASAGLLR
jgi:uncharacterized protein (TIGR00297 family)